jgi:hypothetical protein
MQDEIQPRALRAIAQQANLDPSKLVQSIEPIRAALKSGSPRQMSLVLRECCPPTVWPWPASNKLLKEQGKLGTRNQQVDLLAHMIIRKDMWSRRLKQLQELARSRPVYLEFRITEVGQDPHPCVAWDKHIEPLDSQFWVSNGPWSCDHPGCCCTVRAYSHAELLEADLDSPNSLQTSGAAS